MASAMNAINGNSFFGKLFGILLKFI